VNSGSAPRHSGDLVLDAWLEANRQNNAQGIAYNRNFYWYVKSRLGPDRVVGPFAWP
jgi:hypothetical protein